MCKGRCNPKKNVVMKKSSGNENLPVESLNLLAIFGFDQESVFREKSVTIRSTALEQVTRGQVASDYG